MNVFGAFKMQTFKKNPHLIFSTFLHNFWFILIIFIRYLLNAGTLINAQHFFAAWNLIYLHVALNVNIHTLESIETVFRRTIKTHLCFSWFMYVYMIYWSRMEYREYRIEYIMWHLWTCVYQHMELCALRKVMALANEFRYIFR